MFFGWPTLHFRRAKVGVCIRCSSVLKIQARKCYIESLSLVAEDKKAASHKVKGPLYSCLLIPHLPSGSRMLNWHLETIAFFSCDYISSTDLQTHTQIASFPGSPWEQGHTQALWQKCNGAWENPARRHTGDVMIQPPELSISIKHIMRLHKVHVSMATIDLSYLSVYIMRMRQKRETSKLQHSKQQGEDYRHYNYCRSENFCIKNNNSRFKFSR